MCGIIGTINYNIKNIIKGLEIIKNRGPDNFGITDLKTINYSKDLKKLKTNNLKGNIFLAHNLLSIVSSIDKRL